MGPDMPKTVDEPLWEAAIDWTGDRAAIRVKSLLGTTFHSEVSRRSAPGDRVHARCPVPWRHRRHHSSIGDPHGRAPHCSWRAPVHRTNLVTAQVKATLANLSLVAPLHNRADWREWRS